MKVEKSKKQNLIIRISILAFLAAAFGAWAWLVIDGYAAAFENGVYSGLSGLISPAVTGIMIFITDFGSSGAIVMVCAVFLALPYTRKTFGVRAAITLAASALLTSALKNIVCRDRPPDVLWFITEHGYGFPSGHTLNSTALFALIALTVWRRTKSKKSRIPMLIIAIIVPLLIGISRIYLGVHSTGDVVGGLIAGTFVALAADTVLPSLSFDS